MDGGIKKYFLFAGHNYYPNGGIKDLKFIGSIKDCKIFFQRNAKEIANGNYIDNWGQIVDAETLKLILIGKGGSSKGNLQIPAMAKWRKVKEK